MKKLIFALLVSVVLVACKDDPQAEKLDDGAYAQSAGRINSLTIVMDNSSWEGEIGEVLRKSLAAPVAGLPQEEPLFSMNQMPASAFSGFARKARSFLKITENVPKGYKTYKNKFARPQMGIEIRGKNNKEIIASFIEHKEDIIKTFKAVELLEKQKRIFKSVKGIPSLKEKMGYTLKLPKAYRIATETDDFYWIRKNIAHGSMNLMLYHVPTNYFQDSLSVVKNIIKMRDTIGTKNILVAEGGAFVTEEAYAPYLHEMEISGRPTYETRGTWEVKNKFMAGPFVNYVIEDKVNQRYTVLEGFVFAPSVDKRDYMFELEAIIKTIRFK